MSEARSGLPGSGLGPTSSFVDVLRSVSPLAGPLPEADGRASGLSVPHGTTVLALRFDGGVVMAGDRRAVEGFQIADERIEKVFPVDEFATVAIAGAGVPNPGRPGPRIAGFEPVFRS